MEKYKEKQERYQLIYNEATIRNERIILNIHLEQIRRFREKHITSTRVSGVFRISAPQTQSQPTPPKPSEHQSSRSHLRSGLI
jgi:hypothetical protein